MGSPWCRTRRHARATEKKRSGGTEDGTLGAVELHPPPPSRFITATAISKREMNEEDTESLQMYWNSCVLLTTHGGRRQVHEYCTDGPPCHLSRSVLWHLPSPRRPQPERAPLTQEMPPTARFTTVTTEGGTGTLLSPPSPNVGTHPAGRSHDQLRHGTPATVAPLLRVHRPAVPAAVALLVARPTHNRLRALPTTQAIAIGYSILEPSPRP